ncbi:MAG: hypothetical protein KIT31_01640 [Deltaproteobacteria bacterium]|nr:hypothetical protein [Deltaproteobacteria bacterium]
MNSERADLVIVGAGAAGTHVLAALAQRKRLDLRSIGVVEAGDDPGPGLAYGDGAHPLHTFGRVPTRRRERGDELRVQLARSLHTLRERGIAVALHERCPARALHRDGDGWVLDTRRAPIAADACVLAVGHWHVHALAHLRRAVDWRWDIRRLAAITDDEDALVLGASQSAIDLAIALAHRGSYRGTITLASRTGLLPRVWGYVGDASMPRHLDRLRSAAATNVRLEDILTAVRADLDDAGGSWSDFHTPGDGLAVLRADLAAARASKAARREIPWQAVLFPTVPAVFDLFPRLPAEDRLAIVPHTYAALRHLEAVHIANAQRILDLADAGRLRCVALGPAPPAPHEDAHHVHLGADLRAHRILDARGHDPHIAHASDAPFLHQLLADGHVVPARIPYATRPDDNHHLDTGGIWLDPTTFTTLGGSGVPTPNLHALGPLAIGQLPVYLGLWALRRQAAAIARAFRTSG